MTDFLNESPLRGTDGARKPIPLLGDVQGGRLKRWTSRHDFGVHAYAGTMVVAAALLSAAVVNRGHPLGDTWVILALGLVALLAERGSIRLATHTEESIALLPIIFAAVLFGPLAASAVAVFSMLGDFRSPYLKWVVYTSSRVVTASITGLAAQYTATAVEHSAAAIAFAAAASAVVAHSLDVLFASITSRLRGYGSILSAVRQLAPLAVTSLALYTPIVALLAFVYREVSPWTLPLFLAPAIAAHRLFMLYQEQRTLATDLAVANERLEEAGLSFATALVATLEARDRYTAGHSASVANYARAIAERMQLSERDQRLAHVCGLVHDIGKIGLAPVLLEKRGPLSLDERRAMEAHSVIGEGILRHVNDYREIARIVRHHHERVDGFGYPDRLRGDEIPLVSRIIAVADAYDAMTSDRPYREAMPARVARLRLAQAVGSQFDLTVVAAFEAILASSPEMQAGSSGPSDEAVSLSLAGVIARC